MSRKLSPVLFDTCGKLPTTTNKKYDDVYQLTWYTAHRKISSNNFICIGVVECINVAYVCSLVVGKSKIQR